MNYLPIFVLFMIAVTKVTSENNTEGGGVTCIGSPLNMPDDKEKIRNNCFAEFGETYDNGRGPEPKNITCIWVCYLKRTGLISDENTFLKDKLAENFRTYGFPNDAIEPLVKEISTCIDTKGSSFKVEDGTCKSISETYDCFGMAFNKVCKPTKV